MAASIIICNTFNTVHFPLFSRFYSDKCYLCWSIAAFRGVSLQLLFTLTPETDMQSTGKWGWTFPALLIDNFNEGSSRAIHVWLQSRHRQVREQTWLDSKVDSTTDLSISCAASPMRSFFVEEKTFQLVKKKKKGWSFWNNVTTITVLLN